jgi:outer membrane receptor for ferric coprogen and ferric-rhodotorulic acid
MKTPQTLAGRLPAFVAIVAAGLNFLPSELNAQPKPAEDALVLSPFEVQATADAGYEVGESNSALKITVETKNLPFSLSVLSADLMRDFSTMNEVEALRLNAGVNATENLITKSQNRPYIRGTSSVRVYADGLFLNSLITPNVAVDRVEILKGASGNLFGLGEPGGTLNYVYKPALAKPRGSLGAGVGSWGERFAQVDMGGPLTGDGKLTTRFAASYQTGDAFTDYTQTEFREYYARLRYAFRPKTTLQATIAHSNRNTVSPSRLQYDGFAGRRQPVNEATFASRYASFGADPISTGLINRYTNLITPDSFADVVTTTAQLEFNHELSPNWWIRAAGSRTHMDRDSLLTPAFNNIPVTVAGSTLAPSPANGQPVATSTARGDLLASADGGQLAYDNLASDSVQVNLLGELNFAGINWRTVLGADYNKEVFYGDRWRSSWLWSTNASERASQLPEAQRVAPVVANILNAGAGFNLRNATPPLGTFSVPDGNFTNTSRGPGYYWINHAKLWQDRVILTGSVRRDEAELVNRQLLQLSRREVLVGQADQPDTTYSVGGVFRVLPQLSVYASHGTTFRPQVTLLRDRAQNAFLAEPIQGAGSDLGLRWSLPERGLEFSGGVFRVKQSNLVITLSELQPDGSSLVYQEQSGENQVDGYEFEASAKLGGGFSLNLSYAYLDSFVRSNRSAPLQVGQELAQTPEHTVVLLARYQPTKQLSFGTAVNWVVDDRIYLSAPNNNPLNRAYTSGYTTADLFAAYEWRFGRYRVRHQLNVYNLADELYAVEFGTGRPRSFRFSTTLFW